MNLCSFIFLESIYPAVTSSITDTSSGYILLCQKRKISTSEEEGMDGNDPLLHKVSSNRRSSSCSVTLVGFSQLESFSSSILLDILTVQRLHRR
ncbi:hypothetical protein SAY87_001058 [Trapa incisa]|uniref:Uncharacterized protein n=1 Tax=Trapa incisa TaxID=236973 RepID=A0AAN7GP05_9MYRT|nr:hypothetical protein SAY87_001058 [Trapa incisa]